MKALTSSPYLALAAISLAPLAFAAPAHAVSVTLDGKSYDVYSQEAVYNENKSLFSANPWWGSQSLAIQFAIAVYDQLGEPDPTNQSGYGPIFAYTEGSGIQINGIVQNIVDPNEQVPLDLAADSKYTYAFVDNPAPVPAPIPLFGAFAALSGLGRLTKSRTKMRTLRNAARAKKSHH